MRNQTHQKRYPGVKPFETSEKDLFFGRDKDIEDLLDYIWLEKLVVLFGKSGYGKSSLINAGILPEIEKEAVPIIVRIGSYVAGASSTPVENLRNKIEEVLQNNPEADFLENEKIPKNLWQLLKRKQTRKKRRFVFVFDQFEEFFTHPLLDQQVFNEQLAHLLYTEVPQAVRNLNDTFSDTEQTFIATPFDAKVLFAIRADRMSLLDSMKDKLPAILQKRYELKGLSAEQARSAIEQPAQKTGDFASPVFTYSPEALQKMTDLLAETKGTQRAAIEAFQLQILCEYIEDKIIKGEIAQNRVEPSYFADKINDIYEGYYQRLIDKLAEKDQKPAQLLIEEKLIFEGEKTSEARRLSVDSGVLMSEQGITQNLLNQLESSFLLRRESTATGGFNYEVSHDTLIAPILKSKQVRKAAEKAEADRIAAIKRRNKTLAAIGAVIAIFAVVLGIGIYMYQQNVRLDNSLKELDKALKDAKAQTDLATKRLKDFEEAQKAKEIVEFRETLANVEKVLKAKNCPSESALKKINEMKDKYATDTELQTKIQSILSQMAHCQ